jgi:hypothetical protein
MFIFEILCTIIDSNPGFETGPLYSTIDRYIFDLWKGYKLKSTPLLWVEGIGKFFITDSVLAWYYMIFDKQEIIVSATDQLSRKLGTKW